MTKKFKRLPKENVSRKKVINTTKTDRDRCRLQANTTNPLKENEIIFSFKFFTREHSLFNLSDRNKAVNGTWFLELLNCLSEVAKLTISELKQFSKFQMHPINWETTNIDCPILDKEEDFWQFRINKSKGRIIGFLIDNLFYIVWLDYHHNLTSCEGYGGAESYKYALSDYELLEQQLNDTKEQVKILRKENEELEEMLNEYLK